MKILEHGSIARALPCILSSSDGALGALTVGYEIADQSTLRIRHSLHRGRVQDPSLDKALETFFGGAEHRLESALSQERDLNELLDLYNPRALLRGFHTRFGRYDARALNRDVYRVGGLDAASLAAVGRDMLTRLRDKMATKGSDGVFDADMAPALAACEKDAGDAEILVMPELDPLRVRGRYEAEILALIRDHANDPFDLSVEETMRPEATYRDATRGALAPVYVGGALVGVLVAVDVPARKVRWTEFLGVEAWVGMDARIAIAQGNSPTKAGPLGRLWTMRMQAVEEHVGVPVPFAPNAGEAEDLGWSRAMEAAQTALARWASLDSERTRFAKGIGMDDARPLAKAARQARRRHGANSPE